VAAYQETASSAHMKIKIQLAQPSVYTDSTAATLLKEVNFVLTAELYTAQQFCSLNHGANNKPWNGTWRPTQQCKISLFI